ncbi:MAG: hypothetical protein SFV24_19280 [Gemmatimonadales bacterium]|nr:hypothetical protein [Gemmatimonadales bacterium]
MALTTVERYWVSEFHPGEPVNECKPAYLEMVEAADYDELRTTLARALHLLWIGMEVGLDPVEKDEATALFVKYGDGEAFTGSLAEIIGDERPASPASAPHRIPEAHDRSEAMSRFGEWFAKNYPGPDTVISDPFWHAPRLFRAVENAMRVAPPPPAPATEPHRFAPTTMLGPCRDCGRFVEDDCHTDQPSGAQ